MPIDGARCRPRLVRWWHCIGPTWTSHAGGSQSGLGLARKAHGTEEWSRALRPTHGAIVRNASRVPVISGPRVLCKDDGRPLSRQSAWTRVRRAVRLAGVHILRHTFCSHLAMQGASGKAIQELAWHQELSVTQGTCTSVRTCSGRRFDCSTRVRGCTSVETLWRRPPRKNRS